MTPEQRAALVRHGYDPDLLPRGVTGGPGRIRVSFAPVPPPGAWAGWPYLRNRVCVLDGIVIDGHEGSDLDPTSTVCTHCDYEGPNP